MNDTGYGLTSGLESLDDREQDFWRERIKAGNLYINRPTTGAVVLRQPFGGMGKSVFGPGIKAGGPNYVAQFMDFSDAPAPVPSPDEPPSDPFLAQLSKTLADRIHRADATKDPMGVAEVTHLLGAISSYSKHFREEFGRTHDHFKFIGQDNLRRYLPVPEIRVRVHLNDTVFDIFARICAARTVGCGITVSKPEEFESDALESLHGLTES